MESSKTEVNTHLSPLQVALVLAAVKVTPKVMTKHGRRLAIYSLCSHDYPLANF